MAQATLGGSYGDGDDQFKYPRDVAYCPERNAIFVVDKGNNRIQVFDFSECKGGPFFFCASKYQRICLISDEVVYLHIFQ